MVIHHGREFASLEPLIPSLDQVDWEKFSCFTPPHKCELVKKYSAQHQVRFASSSSSVTQLMVLLHRSILQQTRPITDKQEFPSFINSASSNN